MYQNSIYNCIFCYGKIYWFPMKKCWCQHNSKGVSGDSYIFGSSIGKDNCAKFHLSRICVTDFMEGGPLCRPPIREQPRKSPSYIRLERNYVHHKKQETFKALTALPSMIQAEKNYFWRTYFFMNILLNPENAKNDTRRSEIILKKEP